MYVPLDQFQTYRDTYTIDFKRRKDRAKESNQKDLLVE